MSSLITLVSPGTAEAADAELAWHKREGTVPVDWSQASEEEEPNSSFNSRL